MTDLQKAVDGLTGNGLGSGAIEQRGEPKMRFTAHRHKREWVVFDNQERLAILNYRAQSAAEDAAAKSNAACRVVSTPYR